MGLDMNLTAEKYISGYDFRPAEERATYHRLVKEFGVAEIVQDHSPSATVSFTVAYWRKAHAIHAWFVSEVQDGQDDCKRYYVDQDKLIELRGICQTLLLAKDPMKAAASALGTLPPEPGFGAEYFREDIEETITQIDRVLTLGDGFSIYYEASW